MAGRIAVVAILAAGLLAGVGLYYFQVFHFYERADPPPPVVLTLPDGGLERLEVAALDAIDASSSPIRYRACFRTDARPEELAARFAAYRDPEPRVAPFWFGCYDAASIAEALEAGAGAAFLGEANVVYGIDRVVAVLEDGRGFVWHQINRCGEEVFDGRPPPEGCPAPPAPGG